MAFRPHPAKFFKHKSEEECFAPFCHFAMSSFRHVVMFAIRRVVISSVCHFYHCVFFAPKLFLGRCTSRPRPAWGCEALFLHLLCSVSSLLFSLFPFLCLSRNFTRLLNDPKVPLDHSGLLLETSAGKSASRSNRVVINKWRRAPPPFA